MCHIQFFLIAVILISLSHSKLQTHQFTHLSQESLSFAINAARNDLKKLNEEKLRELKMNGGKVKKRSSPTQCATTVVNSSEYLGKLYRRQLRGTKVVKSALLQDISGYPQTNNLFVFCLFTK